MLTKNSLSSHTEPDSPRSIEELLVPHGPFQSGIKKLEWGFREGGRSAEPVCIPVLGETRTGKSRLIEHVVSKHPPQRFNDGLHVPILHARVPSMPTVKGMCEILLRRMGDPLYHKGTEQEKSGRLEVLLGQAGSQMIALDEFNHFVDKKSARVQLAVSDWLKTVAENAGVSLALLGLPYSEAVIQQNEQLKGRSTRAVRLPRFEWSEEESKKEFIKILRCFDRYLDSWTFPEIGSSRVAFRLYCASGGLMGYLVRVLRFAMEEAYDRGDTAVQMGDFATGYLEALWDSEEIEGLEGVFDPGTAFRVSNARLEAARRVGRSQATLTPSNQPSAPPRRRGTSSAQALSR